MTDPDRPLDPDVADDIDRFVHDWLIAQSIPGASVVVFDREGVRHASGVGTRRLETNDPATPETLYGFASCTKTVTAAAVLSLVGEGRLGLDDEVSEYVDYFESVPGDPITVRELLTHTSGMPDDEITRASFEPLKSGEYRHPVPMSDDDDIRRNVERSADGRVTDEERFFYYNTGFNALASVVGEVTGTSFAEYVRETLLAPLGMARSTFDEETFEAADDRITAYSRRDGELVATDPPFGEFITGAGGLRTSVREFAAFVRMLANDGRHDDEQVLPAELVASMREPQITAWPRVFDPDIEYGYGLMRFPFLDDAFVGHGGTELSMSGAGYLEERGLGVVLASNAVGDVHAMEAAKGVLALAAGADPESAVSSLALRRKLDDLSGVYENAAGTEQLTVERDGSTLELTFTYHDQEETLEAVPQSADPDDLRFVSYVSTSTGNLVVEFRRREGGTDCFVERARYTRPS